MPPEALPVVWGDYTTMARTAARCIVERIRAGGMGAPMHDVLPIQLVRRESTGTRA